jgi:hypothetical protein
MDIPSAYALQKFHPIYHYSMKIAIGSNSPLLPTCPPPIFCAYSQEKSGAHLPKTKLFDKVGETGGEGQSYLFKKSCT